MDYDDETSASWAHFIAGATAGTVEHIGMYPIDTIKTHMQAQKGTLRAGISDTFRTLVRTGGVRALFRGITAIAAGAAPAHAVFFGTWEASKRMLGVRSHEELRPIESGLSGVIATILGEGVLSPMDAVKQKRQLNAREYTGTIDCIKKIARTDGWRSLYIGYTTTMTMQIPYHFIAFPFFEALKKHLKSDSKEHDAAAHLLAGAGAGAVASAVTNPLDVARTRLQTMHELKNPIYTGMVDALQQIWRQEGISGFTRGISARMMFHSTSAACMWVTYEYMKFVLKADEYVDSHSHQDRQ